jgi:hypothetical protein
MSPSCPAFPFGLSSPTLPSIPRCFWLPLYLSLFFSHGLTIANLADKLQQVLRIEILFLLVPVSGMLGVTWTGLGSLPRPVTQ